MRLFILLASFVSIVAQANSLKVFDVVCDYSNFEKAKDLDYEFFQLASTKLHVDLNNNQVTAVCTEAVTDNKFCGIMRIDLFKQLVSYADNNCASNETQVRYFQFSYPEEDEFTHFITLALEPSCKDGSVSSKDSATVSLSTSSGLSPEHSAQPLLCKIVPAQN